MYSTYHFNSVSEITIDVVEAIKATYKGKSIVITIEENDEDDIPNFHKEILANRLADIDNTVFEPTNAYLNAFKKM